MSQVTELIEQYNNGELHREELIQELANEATLDGVETATLDAFFGAIQDNIDEANIPDEFKSEVENELNGQCTIRV